MITRSSTFFVTSDRDAHFTDSLIRNASEYENIAIGRRGGGFPNTVGSETTGVGQAPSLLTSIALHAATDLTFAVSFWSRDTNAQLLAATPYTGNFLGSVLVPKVFGIGTEYCYATTFPPLPYLDEDNTGELHVGLHNLSATTKLSAAGTTAAEGTGRPGMFCVLKVGMISAA